MPVEITAAMTADLLAVARRAGEAIMEIYGSDFDVEVKDDRSPVTEADRQGEEVILEALRGPLGQGFPIVAEESAAAGDIPDIGSGKRPFWLVDPLDGTKEFIKRRGEFTVNIALIAGGHPVFGVVHAPAIRETYVGGPGGAQADIRGSGMKPISCREVPAEGVSAVVSISHKSPETDDFLAKFRVANEVAAGSSLKFCRVAAGAADLYPRLGRTMEWDIAAGHAVVAAAGGRVVTLDGRDMTYGKPEFENPHFVALGRGLPWPE